MAALKYNIDLDDELFERTAALFAALADPERLRILARLTAGEACVGELAEEFGQGMSTISQRLKLLWTERLVSKRRDGKHIIYSLNDDHVLSLVTAGLEHVTETL